MPSPIPQSSKHFSWQEIESKIQVEISWLKEKLETFLEIQHGVPVSCKDCILRNIATLIVSGRVQASEIKKGSPLKSFWGGNSQSFLRKIHHGSDWHREKMEEIEAHFLSLGYEVLREPALDYGRADLGIYSKNTPDLFVEVGTISLFKLWKNLETMENVILLIVPNNEELIEFVKTPYGKSL